MGYKCYIVNKINIEASIHWNKGTAPSKEINKQNNITYILAAEAATARMK